MSSERDARGEQAGFAYRDGKLPDRAALEDVLRETLAAQQAEPLVDGELEALLSVARRYPGAELTQEPIAAELVESMLRLRLTRLDAPPAYWQSMALEIAGSLCQTPAAEQRLDGLWRRLLEAAV